MNWLFAVLLRIALTHLLCHNVSSQEGTPDLKKDIANGVFELTAKLNQLLYKKSQQNGNVLFSPLNIYSALALVHLGADGNTRDELASLLRLPKDSTKLQQTHEILSQILRTIEKTTEVSVFGDIIGGRTMVPYSATIKIANGLFVQNGVKVIPSYTSQVQSYYKGEVSNVDFMKESSKATDVVNQFVSKSTNGRIPKLFSSPLSTDTRVLLASCLYFKAAWDNAFSEYYTKEENFDTGSGNVLTKMMSKNHDVPYINLPELQSEAISLSYAGNDASVIFVLPHPNQTLDNALASQNAAILQRIVKQAKQSYVDIKIPQSKFKWSNDIKDFLVQLGINDLFSNSAKLNNIVSGIALKVSNVTHAAEIELNEKGTEASAATVIHAVPERLVLKPKPIPFHVNRPFAFFIHHHKTETILFAGAVHNPNGISNALRAQ